MKKIVSVILAIAMFLCATAVFAEGIPDEIVHDGDLPKTSEKAVSIKISADDEIPVEYHVAVKWTTSDGAYTLGKGGVTWDCDELKYILDDTEGEWTAPTCSVTVTNASTPGNDVTAVPGIEGTNAWVDSESQSLVKTIKIGETDILTSSVSPVTVKAVESATAEAQGDNGVEDSAVNQVSFTYAFDFDMELLAQRAFELALAKADPITLTNTYVVTIGVPSSAK